MKCFEPRENLERDIKLACGKMIKNCGNCKHYDIKIGKCGKGEVNVQ